MSTEKSLLTIEDVTFPRIACGKEKDGLYFPVGVLPSGNLEVVHLIRDKGTAHACVFGVPGSGKTKYVEFVLKALHRMYGSDVTLHYLDGKGCEYMYWEKQNMPFKYIRDCSQAVEFDEALNMLCHWIDKKTTAEPELVVVDDVSALMYNGSSQLRLKLWNLYVEGARKNVQLLYASQTPKGRVNDVRDCFGLTCATRLSEETSNDIFEHNIASIQAGVRRYGDLTYSYNGFVSRARVPFCDNTRKENPYD